VANGRKKKKEWGGGAREKLKRNYRKKLNICKSEKKAENLIYSPELARPKA
jgi:hypothetical protein